MSDDSDTGHRYRGRIKTTGLTGFTVRIEQTDLFIRAGQDLTAPAYDLTARARRIIEDWADQSPEFLTSLIPLPVARSAISPVKEMLSAGNQAGVGPMAAVAGAIAEYVGRGLLPHSPAGVIVENGGDIFLAADQETVVGLWAGDSPLSLRLGLAVPPEKTPVGICTSSGTVGHSMSLGRSDAAMVVARPTALADAAATALGNRIKRPGDIEPALDWALALDGVSGAAVILGDRFGCQGDLELRSLF